MKPLFLLAMLIGATSVAVAQVSPEEHAAHHPEKAAASAESPRKAMPPDSSMPERMSMQDLMSKIDQTKDPAERARLLEQHRKAMHEQLASMKHMGCGSGPESHGMGDKNAAEKA